MKTIIEIFSVFDIDECNGLDTQPLKINAIRIAEGNVIIHNKELFDFIMLLKNQTK